MSTGHDEDHDDVLHHLEVALGDRVQEQAAQAGHDEHPLDDDRADEQRRQLQGENGNHGDGGVAEPVPAHGRHGREPLGPGRPKVVLLLHVEDRAADIPGEDSALYQPEGQRGQDQLLEEHRRVDDRRRPAVGRQPAELHREDGDQEDAGEEGRDRRRPPVRPPRWPALTVSGDGPPRALPAGWR
jgi:hypothetical protein